MPRIKSSIKMAAIYIRINPSDEREKISEQRQAIYKYCLDNGIILTNEEREYIDIESGLSDIFNRRNLPRLAKRNDIDIILVASFDRISRNIFDLVTFNLRMSQYKIDLVSVSENLSFPEYLSRQHIAMQQKGGDM